MSVPEQTADGTKKKTKKKILKRPRRPFHSAAKELASKDTTQSTANHAPPTNLLDYSSFSASEGDERLDYSALTSQTLQSLFLSRCHGSEP